MSTQEERFAQIAAAIREKDGSTAPICALDFAERIRALSVGGGGSCGFAVPLTVTVDAGAQVTASQGETSVTGTAGEDGVCVLILPAPGTWEVTASRDGKEKSTEVEVSPEYTAEIQLFSRLPDGYTELEYIESTGTQYIDTGVSNFTRLRIEAEMEHTFSSTSSAQYPFCCKRSSDTYYMGFAIFSSGISCRYSGGSQKMGEVSPARKLRYGIHADTSTYYLGEEKFTPSVSLTWAFNTMYIFALHNASSANYFCRAKLYRFQITNASDGSFVRQFVPCVNPSGAVGLYDLATDTFYGNKGTGVFLAGPAI